MVTGQPTCKFRRPNNENKFKFKFTEGTVHPLKYFVIFLTTVNLIPEKQGLKKFFKKHLFTPFEGRRHSLFEKSHELLGQKNHFFPHYIRFCLKKTN